MSTDVGGNGAFPTPLSEGSTDAHSVTRLECDIVMAGGVTSGIVYPGAVAAIARRFVFRSIGGTSVGALAAAVTAAAEFGRQTKKNPASFDALAGLHEELATKMSDGHTRLFHLFTANRGTAALLAIVLPFFSGRSKSGKLMGFIRATLTRWPVLLSVIIALVAGLVPAAALFHDRHIGLAIVVGASTLGLLLLLWSGTVIAMFLLVWYPALRKNFYGICVAKSPPQGTPGEDAKYERLTTWMHQKIQAMAGMPVDGPPLTFGNLWTASDRHHKEDLSSQPRQVDLAMITSDISRNRMTQLPFVDFPTPLYVEIDVLRAFFPDSVVEWMSRHHAPPQDEVSYDKPHIRLPRPQDLPVIVATRMSLSFPILMSAIPLLTPDYPARVGRGPTPLRRVWFSDGGLVSNFPIHFFDSPMPSRPTFCLNLVDFGTDLGSKRKSSAEDAKRRAANREPVPSRDPQPGDKVWDLITMSKGNSMVPAPFTSFDKGPGSDVFGFFNALLSAARGWSDNQLLLAPGVRERVVDVGLRDDEGGLNLEMSPEAIRELSYRGKAAGLLISSRFDPAPGPDLATGAPKVASFPNHRWVRFRNTMAAMEDLLRRFALARRRSDAAANYRKELDLSQLIASGPLPDIGYHPLPSGSQAYYWSETKQLEAIGVALASALQSNPLETFDVTDSAPTPASPAPKPKMRMQTRPLVSPDPRAARGDSP